MGNIVGRLQSLFPAHQLDVIIGSLLGDACLECRSVGARSPITARFRVHHGEKQKNYVWWKYEILKDLVLREPCEISWTNPKRMLHEVSLYFHTKSLRNFGILYHYFYPQKVKILPAHIFDLLTPKMLAVWFMDDGSYNGNNITLNTQSLPKNEQLRIVDYLRDKLSIYSTVVKEYQNWKVYIGSRDFRNFLSIIEPHIIPSMAYKIGNPRNDLFAAANGARGDTFANTSVPTLEMLGKV